MPLGETYEVKSLRSITAAAAASHFFHNNKSLLFKCYQLGTFPVMVIDDIYCQGIRAAIAQSRKVLQEANDDCSKAWINVRLARIRLSDAKDQAARAKFWGQYDEDIDKLTGRVTHHTQEYNTYCSLYEHHAGDQVEKLKKLKDILTKEEREAIARANPTGEINAVFKKLEYEIASTKLTYSWGPTRIKTGETDQLCV